MKSSVKKTAFLFIDFIAFVRTPSSFRFAWSPRLLLVRLSIARLRCFLKCFPSAGISYVHETMRYCCHSYDIGKAAQWYLDNDILQSGTPWVICRYYLKRNRPHNLSCCIYKSEYVAACSLSCSKNVCQSSHSLSLTAVLEQWRLSCSSFV